MRVWAHGAVEHVITNEHSLCRHKSYHKNRAAAVMPEICLAICVPHFCDTSRCNVRVNVYIKSWMSTYNCVRRTDMTYAWRHVCHVLSFCVSVAHTLEVTRRHSTEKYNTTSVFILHCDVNYDVMSSRRLVYWTWHSHRPFGERFFAVATGAARCRHATRHI